MYVHSSCIPTDTLSVSIKLFQGVWQKLVDDSQTDWDEKIDAVLMGCRASQQASTKHSSYFHQQMCLPIASEVLPSSIDQGCWLKDTVKEIEANIKTAQKSQNKCMRCRRNRLWGLQYCSCVYSAALQTTSDANEMWRHLEQCFENEKLTPSPSPLQWRLFRYVGGSMCLFMNNQRTTSPL